MSYKGKVTKFLATSNGLCATRWLSFALATRPDVFVAHGKYPLDSIIGGSVNEEKTKKHSNSLAFGNILDLYYELHGLESVFENYTRYMTEARAVGNVHTYVLRQIDNNIQTKVIEGHINLINVVRHPITYVYSHSMMVSKSKKNPYLHDKYREGLFRNVLEKYPLLVSQKEADADDVFSFTTSCFSLKQMAEDLLLDFEHMKMEELTCDANKLHHFCTSLTGLEYNTVDLNRIISLGPVNRHRDGNQSNNPVEIYSEWREWQRIVFNEIMEDNLLDAFVTIDYDLSMIDKQKNTKYYGKRIVNRTSPYIVKKNTNAISPKISLILLDWSCRERFHSLDWLDRQTVSRDKYEIVWVELYDRVIPEVLEKADTVINCSQTDLYHKHKGYNEGLLAARGEIITICDSDAIFANYFIETIFEQFYDKRKDCLSKVLFHYEQRTPAGYHYRDGLEDIYPRGLSESAEMAKYVPSWLDIWPNAGACMSVRKLDAFFFGGFDESESYRGLVCGPYDLGWRMINAGIPGMWEDRVALFHFAHPNSDQNMDSTAKQQIIYPQIEGHAFTAVEAFCSGRIQPIQGNPEIYRRRLDMRAIGTEFEKKYAVREEYYSPINYDSNSTNFVDSCNYVLEKSFDKFDEMFVSISHEPVINKKNNRNCAKISIILLDWSCRDHFHSLDWLEKQNINRNQYEIIWVELFNRTVPEVMDKADMVITCNQEGMYHKHQGYNVGVLNANGDIITICDSDAVFPEDFVESILSSFEKSEVKDSLASKVLMHYEYRSNSRYPEDLVSTEQLPNYDWMTLWPNVGACVSFRRKDIIRFGGFDEDEAYSGYLCGPYDLGWRMVNAGIPEEWYSEETALWHFSHPHSNQSENTDKWKEITAEHIDWHSLKAVQAFSEGRILPFRENSFIWTSRMRNRIIGTEFERHYSNFSDMTPFLTDCLIDLIRAKQYNQVFCVLDRILTHVKTSSELMLWIWELLTKLGNEMLSQGEYIDCGKMITQQVEFFCNHIKTQFGGDNIFRSLKSNSDVINFLHFFTISGFFESNMEKLYEIIMNLLDEIEDSNPNVLHFSKQLVLIGKRMKKKGVIDLCKNCFVTANSLDPLNPDAYLELSKLYIERNDLDLALEFSERGVQVNPSNPDLVMVRIKALEMNGKFADAIRYIEFYWSMYSENKVSKSKAAHDRLPLEHERFMLLLGNQVSRSL